MRAEDHLNESIVAKLRASQSGCGPEEAGVRDLFNCLSDGEDKSRVCEGHHDVRIILLCRLREREREN